MLPIFDVLLLHLHCQLDGYRALPPGWWQPHGQHLVYLLFALCTFLITNFTGTKEYWKEIFWPEVPTWLKVPVPLMPVIELVSIFTKPLALMIRLLPT